MPRRLIPFEVKRGKILRKAINFVNHRLPPLLRATNHFGYAHPHIIDQNGCRVMYYHNDNIGKRGMWLDISRCELNDGKLVKSRKVLLPASRRDAWDSYFVGDPFVLVV